MLAAEKKLDAKLAALKREVAASTADLEKCMTGNSIRRKLYSKVELLRLEYEECYERHAQERSKDSGAAAYAEMDALGKSLRLVPLNTTRNKIRRASFPMMLWRTIDMAIRFVGICLGFVTVGAFLSLPIIVLQVVDNGLFMRLGLVTSYTQFSERIRRAVGRFFLLLSGIFITVEGLDKPTDIVLSSSSSSSSSCTLLTFTHASNVDGFFVCATCPIRHYALAKKELFVVPFFSWISLAIGGVPVDRNHRERAIGALKRSTEAVKNSLACLVVAPEGTRSTTGQLLAFKKGPFYMWEQLQAPVVPLVFIGSFDLYPVGNWINDTGNVVVRYLRPIAPNEAASRDAMCRLLRRRILESLMDCDHPSLTQPLSWTQFAMHYATIAVLLAVDALLYRVCVYVIFELLGLRSPVAVWGSITALTMGVTALLYVYYVYIIGLGGSSKDDAAPGAGSRPKGRKDE